MTEPSAELPTPRDGTPAGDVNMPVLSTAAALPVPLTSFVGRTDEGRELLMRLVWASHWMGRVAHRRGDWPQARGFFERAAQIAERIERPLGDRERGRWSPAARELFWAYGRRAGSIALLELADVSRSIGNRQHAHRCYANAVALLDGAPTAEGRLADRRRCSFWSDLVYLHHRRSFVDALFVFFTAVAVFL